MRLFRTVIFWCHLIVAIPVALVILVMAVTGTLLAYEKQIVAWSDKRTYVVQAGRTRLSPEALLAKVSAGEGRPPANLVLHSDPGAPAEARFGRARTLFVDPHTGAVLGDGSSGARPFFRAVTDWHRWLAQSGDSRDAGKGVTGASNLAFLFLVVSGFYLWWPRNWSRKSLRNVTWFRRGSSGKARNFNWHNTIGFWMTIPLLVIVASGVVISYPWASAAVFKAFGEKPPVRREAARPEAGRRGAPVRFAGLDALYAKATSEVPDWRTIDLSVPRDPKVEVSIAIDRGTGGQPQLRSTTTFDRTTGEVTKREDFSSGTPGRRARTLLRFAHTGEVGGVVGQTLAGLASLGAAVLVWTGLALALHRFRAWRRRAGRPGGETE